MKVLWVVAILALAAAFAGMPLAANPDSVPILCGRPGELDARADDGPPPKPATLPGTYRCSEEGITVTLKLAADGSFVERMEGPGLLGDGGGPAQVSTLTGRWRTEHGDLHLFARPTRPPQIKQVSATRDPSVWMRVEIRQPDGKPAQGLFVGEGDDANPRSAPGETGGVVLAPKDYSWTPGPRHIVRAGDELRLIAFTPTRDGLNTFRFVYQPSEIEPFDHRAQIVKARGTAIVVPFGIAGALLRRVENAAPGK